MLWRARTGYGPVQRFLAWSGLAAMLACFIWLQLLPGGGRSAKPRREAQATGWIRHVIIDPGHGGDDSGAIRNGVLEKDLTLDVARRLEVLINARGLSTTLTRTGDLTSSLASRAEVANKERDCVFVSIHFDEGGRAAAAGVQTFYAARQAPKTGLPSWLPFLQQVVSTPPNLESESLAGFVQQALVARTQAFNRGVRAEQFYVVTNVHHPAVLVEGGFLSNDQEIAKLQTEEYRQQLATAISEGIMRYSEVAGQQKQPTLALGQPGS